MGWLRLGRARGARGRHAAVRQAAWVGGTAPAVPAAAGLPPSPSPATGLPSAPLPAAPPPSSVPACAVELGFRDGTSLRLGADSPHSRALRAVADVLVGGDR